MATDDLTSPRPVDVPTPGFYSVRLVRGGPAIAGRIVHQDGLWVGLLGGVPTAPAAFREPWAAPKMEWIAFSQPITEAAYDELLRLAAEAKPGEPLAEPLKPVDWRRAKSLY